jgi:hypothetical protein
MSAHFLFLRFVLPLVTCGLFTAGATAQQGEAPRLQLPMQCEPNRNCWIANHVDLDPGPAARDYACGAVTYEKHTGVDFALRDLATMQQGVAVLAAAGGTVSGVRDGVADANVREQGREAVAGRECGNGVALDHGGGWTTQYCHLRQGSVRVRKGEHVAAGQPFGLVGMSGLSEYPHLHFALRQGKRVVDPFGGVEGAACAPAGTARWSPETLAQLPYRRGVVYNLGFADGIPPIEQVRGGTGRASELPTAGTKLTLWVEAFAVVPGDTLWLRIYAPDGRKLSEKKVVFDRRQARIFRAIGSKDGARWPAGVYRGEAVMVLAGRAQPEPYALGTSVTLK